MSHANRREMLGLLVVLSVFSSALAQRVYWTGDGKIQRSFLDGSDIQEVISPTLGFPAAIALDEAGSKLYWTDWDTHGLWRINTDGTEPELIVPDLPKPMGIAIDGDNRKVYWSDLATRKIQRADLDGSNVQNVITENLQLVAGLAIDPNTSTLYWSDTVSQTISRSDLEGHDRITVISGSITPWGLAIDNLHGTLFWTDIFNQQIQSTTLEGTDMQAIVANQVSPWGIAVDASSGKLYWADSGSGHIKRANLDGTGEQDFFESYYPMGVAFDPRNGHVYWSGGISQASIDRADTEAAGHLQLITGGQAPYGIAIDDTRGWMYWTEPNHDRLFRARLDGSEQHVIRQGPIWSRIVAISELTEHVFWAETMEIGSQVHIVIFRSNLDGTNPEMILDNGVESGTHGINLGQLAVDSISQHIYWATTSHIWRANLDGTNVTEVWYDPNAIIRSTSIALDIAQQRIYYATGGASQVYRIRRVNMDGTQAETVLEGLNSLPEMIGLDAIQERVCWIRSTPSYSLSCVNYDGTGLAVLVGIEYRPVGFTFLLSPEITSSEPSSCSIDAREPHEMKDSAEQFGWNSIGLTFSGPLPQTLSPDDFSVSEVGGDTIPPAIVGTAPLTENRLMLAFGTSFEPAAWTCVRHIASGSHACLGYLPGDVNGDHNTSSTDLLRLIDRLNEACDPLPPPCEYADFQTDIDRSGDTDAADILNLIDLLNGAGAFEPWLGRSLPPCP